jgi:DNA-binding PadR family transcriptional regulator
MGLDEITRYAEPSILILASLAGGEKHGYAIMEDIKEMTGVRLGPGTLYGAISRLEKHGFIKSLSTEDRRRPYCIMPSGEKALREHLLNLNKIATIGLGRLDSI